jgi:monoamine oxidase
MNYDIIIIGAGATGLLAGCKLAEAGKRVAILEACSRIGGRIHTMRDSAFSMPIEVGAEFVHGKLPITTKLVEEAGMKLIPVEGNIYMSKNGKLGTESDFVKHSGTLEEKLKGVKEDITIAEFLDTYLGEEKYAELRTSLRRFVEGYDAADSKRMSTLAFREEWLGSEDEQFRIEGGYTSLMNFQANECRLHGGEIYLDSAVKKISWKKDQVTVITTDKKKYSAEKILVTVPLGVLSSDDITFDPPITKKIAAAKKMGYGGVIKIQLEFKSRFWVKDSENPLTENQVTNLGFVISEQIVPTWWTQLPKDIPILSGWISGPSAEKHKNISEDLILIEALRSVAAIFKTDVKVIEMQLKAWKITNWLTDPHFQGAYSYATLKTPEAKLELNKPEQDTLYFAGEALYEGSEMGTVEGAFGSALDAVKKTLGEG